MVRVFKNLRFNIYKLFKLVLLMILSDSNLLNLLALKLSI